MDDKKSDTVFQSESAARKYVKFWFIVSAEMKDMRRFVLWMTSSQRYLFWIDGYR